MASLGFRGSKALVAAELKGTPLFRQSFGLLHSDGRLEDLDGWADAIALPHAHDWHPHG